MGLFRSRVEIEPAPAEYYSSDTDLYRVEQLAGERALIADCRTGSPIDVPVSFMRRLRPVRTRDDAGHARR